MAEITYYPVGNADSIVTKFNDNRLMLVDYYQRVKKDDKDKRIDLESELRKMLKTEDKEHFDILAFTHADADHCQGAEDFFWLDHAEKYRGDDRIKINDMWIPACFVTESGLEGSARILRQEARHRLKKGTGIHVFGQPAALDDWFRENDIDPDSRKHLIWTAGKCVPAFGKSKGNAEVFVHSPFSFRMEGDEEDRNNSSIVLHITFFEGDHSTRVMYSGDAEYQTWSDIVLKTQKKKRNQRLIWDVFKIAHHCSYTALGPEKGKSKTEPVEKAKELFDLGTKGCILVSSSDIIPTDDSKQPPHMQAKAYYQDVADEKDGGFVVTMEKPTKQNPKPIVIGITKKGASWKKITGVAAGIGAVTSKASPRLGGSEYGLL